MTIESITKSRRKLVNGKLYFDPMQADIWPLHYAFNELHATDILIIFTSNPFIDEKKDTLMNYVLTCVENIGNSKHLLVALKRLRAASDNPQYYKELFSTSTDVRIAGIYPTTTPMAPNEQNLTRVKNIIAEVETFSYTVGSLIKDQLP
jgi:hypothetical protein